jgi:DNA-binding NtrC family response regulator
MTGDSLLKGKRVLLVDDEPDILETLEHLLPMCKVEKAGSFERARELMESEPFDVAVLDIMGVDGYTLLDLAKKNGIIPVMLTANALSVEDTIRSYKAGAASYLPKDQMINIERFLLDILEAREKGEHPWDRWMDRMGAYYEKKFGPDWKNPDQNFWRKFPSW